MASHLSQRASAESQVSAASALCPCATWPPGTQRELSPAMAAQLREKPGADAIGVTIGDLATGSPGGPASRPVL